MRSHVRLLLGFACLAAISAISVGCTTAKAASSAFVITDFETSTPSPLPVETPEEFTGNAPQPVEIPGSGDSQQSDSTAPAGDIAYLVQRQVDELQAITSELADLEKENRELSQTVGRLVAEIVTIKGERRMASNEANEIAANSPFHNAEPLEGPKPPSSQVYVATAPWCNHCRAWENDKTQNRVSKTFVDISGPRPDFIGEAEWNAVLGKIRQGNMLPAAWWTDRSGTIQVLEGRWTDSALESSIQQADTRALARIAARPTDGTSSTQCSCKCQNCRCR